MLGISARRRREANATLREFFSHAERHPHGWGLARFNEGGALVAPGVEKEPVKATVSEHLRHLLDDKIDDPTVLAHIRFATVGTMEYENCHPFTGTDNSGRVWTLVHNGTIFAGASLNDYMGLQFGETDSERVLLHLIARIDRAQNRQGRALAEKERFDVLSSAIGALAKGNKLNLLVFDGEVLYAHTNFRGSLHFLKEDGAVTLSTNPLSQGDWKPVPFTRLVAIKGGEFVREGPSHGNEYIYNPDDYRFVYMNFARL
jgi:glutamine amidotransferase